jgi:hypothetical protein
VKSLLEYRLILFQSSIEMETFNCKLQRMAAFKSDQLLPKLANFRSSVMLRFGITRFLSTFTYVNTYIPLALCPKGLQRYFRGYQNYLAMRNAEDVSGGKPIAV